MKRFISAVTLSLVLCQSASAATISTATYSNGIFSLSGTTDEVNKPVKIEVFNNGMDYEDAKNVTADNIRDIYLHIDQSYSDSYGKFGFEVPTGGKIGNFSVKVSFLSGEELKSSFYTYTDAQLETAVKTFSDDAEKTNDKLDALIKNYYLGLGIDIGDVKALSDDEYDALLTSVITNGGEDEIAELVNKELILSLASAGTDAETLEKYSAYTELKQSNYYDDWKALSTDDKQSVCDSLKGVADSDEMNRKTENEVIIKTLTNTIWSDMENKLTYYKDNISLDLSDVKKLSDSEQKKVYVAFKNSLVNGDITEISQINSALAALADEYDDSDSNSGGGGTGSKGSSSSSSGFTAPIASSQSGQTGKASPFDDIASVEWASTAIVRLYEKGIVTGKGDKLFDPEGSVTREEFTAMIVRAFGLTADGTASGFDDVPENRWSSSAVAAAKYNGIVKGVSDTYFGASDKILRRDIAVIAFNAAVKHGATFEDGNLSSFADSDKIAEYAKDAVSKLSYAKIVNGSNGSFNPDSFATRAEAAAIIFRIMQYCAMID